MATIKFESEFIGNRLGLEYCVDCFIDLDVSYRMDVVYSTPFGLSYGWIIDKHKVQNITYELTVKETPKTATVIEMDANQHYIDHADFKKEVDREVERYLENMRP